jgi:hypothetical protein
LKFMFSALMDFLSNFASNVAAQKSNRGMVNFLKGATREVKHHKSHEICCFTSVDRMYK